MREFWSSPLFLAFKTFIPPWSFAIQHSDFSSFLAVSTTDKPVNRNIHALPLKQLNVFALRGFIFRDIHKKQGRSSSNSGYEIQKICGWKIYSRTRTFGAEVHKSNIRVKKLAQQVWKWWIRLKDKFCFNDLLTKSNRTEIQTFKVEKRTFGTPCKSSLLPHCIKRIRNTVKPSFIFSASQIWSQFNKKGSNTTNKTTFKKIISWGIA